MSADLYGLFERTAQARPAHAALLRGGEAVSFAALQQQSLALADGLRQAGVQPGERVIVWTENSPETAALLLGCWARGAVPVLMDHTEPRAHLENAIRRVAPVLLVHPGHLPPPAGADAVPMRPVQALAGAPNARPAGAARLPTDPASIVFTSGSTGDPKGVTQSHGSLARGCLTVGRYLGLRAEDRLLCPIPWAFDYGYGQLLSTCLLGVTQVIPDAFNPFGICSAIAAHRPSVLAGLPSLFTYLFRGVSPLRSTDLSSIRVLTNTGGTIPGPVLAELFAAFPQAEVYLNYGLTESYRTAYLPPALARAHPTSIGAGIPGVDVVLLREDDTRCAVGEEGQIVHRGDYLFSGYWGDPEATARALRPDPLLPAGAPPRHPVLYTGDYGVIDERGLLYFRGRRDHQLKSMGVRVNAAEIEALIHASGLATELAVLGVPHDLLGHEIWCFAVPSSAGADGLRALRAWCHAQLSPYQQPRRFEGLAALPKTRTNKIDYPELRRLAAARPSASVV